MLVAHLTSAFINLTLAGIPVIIYAGVQRYRNKRTFTDIVDRLGFAVPRRSGTWASIVVFVLSLAFIVCRYVSVPLETIANTGSPLRSYLNIAPTAPVLVSTFLYSMVQTGFCEELLFRGLIAGALGRHMALWKANILQAIPFSIMHLPIIFFVPHEWVLIAVVPTLFGLGLGWVRLKSQSVIGPWLIHGVGNWAIALLVLYQP